MVYTRVYLASAKRIHDTDLSGINGTEIKKLFMENYEHETRYIAFDWVFWELNNIFANNTKEIIHNRFGSDSQKLYAFYDALLNPTNKTSIHQMRELAPKWHKFTEEKKLAAYHDFLWVPCIDIHMKEWSREDFSRHISNLKNEGKIKMPYEDAIEALKLNGEERILVDIAKKLTYIKDFKDDSKRMCIYLEKNIYHEISKRMGITLEESSYLRRAEIIKFLDTGKKVPMKLIRQRMEGFVSYYNEKRKLVCGVGDEIKDVTRKFGIQPYERASARIRGIIASQGFAKGTAVIIKTIDDLQKVKEGDVLITFMTHPDYVPAMQKASAIVTDEGGITCHAAIVSREFGLPCIVGAESATQTFKDGDVIEVNANEGYVTKIDS
ncbi:MAG: hypothetical protein KGH61_02870 [Candidatus Micrarchaeota archaeon]|nr:hypothetical protein [Candidatus Micrarchaeota archaeon]MDE1847867.1 hypothetical protein [Candidatus Micrarchaeota archaeon]MDE1864194.1 hypothetical protein [Candidatus Micrarchaeota archaeon]